MKSMHTCLTMIAALGLADIAVAAAPGGSAQAPSPDQVRMAVQQICPVTGNKLGSHGTPVKAKIGEETIFLCCQGCASGKINPTHWATIHANFARAQGICPVMKNKLPASPKWTIVQGQIVYVCCPPCLKKLAAAPETYLKALDELYRASLKQQRTAR